ncbi:hypothetical protein AK88_05446, partial [Plasmodium fragile]
DPKPDITDIATRDAVTHIPTCDTVTDIPTCYTVTHIPTCEDPKPEITQPPGSGNAVTDTPTCEDPKPEITQPPGSGNAVTDTPTCDHPQPDITDITTSHTTTWLRWIDRNKHLLRACTTQPWFNALKSEWKQYLREHMAQHEDNVVSAQREFGAAATLKINKLDAWKAWVAQQHRHMSMYSEQEWFQHLWSNIEETGVVTEEDRMPEQIRKVQGVSHIHTVDEKPTTFVTEHGPPVEKGLQVEQALDGGSALKVRHLPQQQLHQQPYMKKPLTAQTWILILALVIEHCEVERSLQEKELYVDDVLEQL